MSARNCVTFMTTMNVMLLSGNNHQMEINANFDRVLILLQLQRKVTQDGKDIIN